MFHVFFSRDGALGEMPDGILLSFHDPWSFGMDERDIEQGYANFHRALNRILRQRDVREFKRHVARHPGQAGRLSHCLGLSDELAEVEMVKAILVRSPLRDIHHEAFEWLKDRGIEPPAPREAGRGGKRHAGRKGIRSHDRK